MTAAIQTSSLCKDYGPTRAVIDLDLVVEPGQVFAFLGPNGAGKTTTIRMLLALQRPTSGSAALLGLDSARDSVEIHRRIGYLPGDLVLYPRMTGRQHITWHARARGLRDLSFATALAEAAGALTGRRGAAIGIGTALAAASYLVSSLSPVVSSIQPARYASLFYWSVGNSQITQGVTPGDYAVLIITGLCALTAAALAFRRLDIR